MNELLETFIGSNGFAVQVLTIMGVLRLVLKPASEIVGVIVKQTKTTKDDAFVESVKRSGIFLKLLFVLDWLASIKIKK